MTPLEVASPLNHAVTPASSLIETRIRKRALFIAAASPPDSAAGSGNGPSANATSPSNHGWMSLVYAWSPLVTPPTKRSMSSSSFPSIADSSAKPGNFDRKEARASRWSPGRSRRASPYMIVPSGT